MVKAYCSLYYCLYETSHVLSLHALCCHDERYKITFCKLAWANYTAYNILQKMGRVSSQGYNLSILSKWE